MNDNPDAGPHGGPGGVNPERLAEAAIVEAGAGPHGGPGNAAPMGEDPTESDDSEGP